VVVEEVEVAVFLVEAEVVVAVEAQEAFEVNYGWYRISRWTTA
jgi:hypothetical protein